MKLKTSKQNIKNGYNKIISVGYCDAQYLLRNKTPFAYSAGTYGWACDYYDIYGICVCTGYSPLNNKNTNINYVIIREYEERARAIFHDCSLSNEEQRDAVDLLLKELVNTEVAQ